MTVLGFILSLTLYCSTVVDAKVSWQLTSHIIEIGKSVNLTCTVEGLEAIDPNTTRQWLIGQGSKLISFNGRINNPEKYKEILPKGNQFILQIFNVTPKDLESIYECRYGFDLSKKQLEVDKDKIIYPPTKDQMNMTASHNVSTATINISFMMIFPLPNCSIEHHDNTLTEFVLIENGMKGSVAEATVNVTSLPCKDDMSVCNKEYRIVCGSSKYMMSSPEVVYRTENDCTTAIIFVVILSCCLCIVLVLYGHARYVIRKQRLNAGKVKYGELRKPEEDQETDVWMV